MDVNTKAIKKNAFRVTKERGITASRVRVPGGHMDARLLGMVQGIAEKYGNGTVHITSRQGFEIPGIPFEKMAAVNQELQPVIEGLSINQTAPGSGYPASGTRNVTACVGNRVCPYGCYDTTALAQRIEKAIFPNDLHFKIALTGCPNDCAKVRMHDFGIMGMTEPQLEPDRCVNCGACVKYCRKKSVEALREVNYRPQRNTEKCIGCGECVINCPTRAWTRSEEKYYRLTLLGRTGKKNPRLGEDFIKWVDADSIVKIILNTYKYVGRYIDKNAPGGKEHIGYIVDRTGFEEFKKWALDGVDLPDKAEVYTPIYWNGVKY
ncbi:sulfite reductase subunit C [Emergencia sp.]|uniref:sulfite reductase subunit C n=1 Tax=Emergencia sp. TaxID=1926557 RepID=UPI003AEF6175